MTSAYPRSLVLMCLLGAAALAPSSAFAGCSPATGNNVIVTCSGATVDQGPGALTGYGDGTQNGATINVQSTASVTGTNTGIDIGSNNTINNLGIITTGSNNAISINANGPLTLNNSGTIGRIDLVNNIVDQAGISALNTGLSVTNNVGGTIQGFFAIQGLGVGTVVNSGLITGISGGGGGEGIDFFGNNTSSVTVTNNATGVITGDAEGIKAAFATVYNYGTISAPTAGVGGTGVDVNNLVLINYASGLITGDAFGVSGRQSPNLTITNFGTISGTGLGANGVQGDVVNLVNFGTISAVGAAGQAIAMNSGSVTNNAGGLIISDLAAIGATGNTSVFNAGTITGNGGVAITFSGGSNTLTLGPGSVINGVVLGAGGDTFQLGGTGSDSFDLSKIGPAQQYQGFATFNVISGTWTATGTFGQADPWTIKGGTLVVNGDLSPAAFLMVSSGGTLSGTGIVPFTLLDSGATLAPGPLGSGTSMLTIKDRVLFCTCTTYAVKVSGTGNDFAQIMAGGGPGDAFLAGAVRVTSPTSSFRFNSPYTILTTQGGLHATTFDSLATPSGIGGMLSYTANDVLLTLTSQLGQLAGLNTNQRNVASALDTAFNATGSSGALGGIFAGNIAQNLTQASGELATGAQQTTFDAMKLFLGLLTDPFVTGRGSNVTSPSGATPFAEEESANAYAANGKRRSNSERDAYGMITKAAPRNNLLDPNWSIWAAGFGGSQTTDGNAALGSNATTSRVFGIAAGADYLLSPRTIAGFAVAGGGTNFSLANGLGTGRSDLFQAGAFVRHHVGSAYISGALAYGWQDITTDRTVTIAGLDHLRAEFNANAFSGRIEGGYRYVTPWIGGIGITPYAAAQFTTFDLPAYAEQAVAGTNAFALAYASKGVTDTRSELGVRTDKSYAMQNAILTLRGRFAWAHDFNPDRSIAATFQTLPLASFVVNGAAQSSDSALTTASAEMKWINGWSAAATFEGEFSDVTRSYAGKGVVRYQW